MNNADIIHALRQRCLDDLYFLVTEILYPDDRAKYGDLHKWMCDTVGKKPRTRELWLLPRDHFKTTILTIGHAIQQLLRDPAFNFFMASSKDEHPMEWSNEIRRHFTTNLRMRLLFAPWCSTRGDDMGATQVWTTPARKYFGVHRREPTCTVLSFKGRVESKHYRWGYLDDCMSEEDTSETGLKEAQENFKKFIPLIDTDGGILMPGTRKHYNDIYQRVMDMSNFKVYVRHGLEHPTDKCSMDECSRFAEKHPAPDFSRGTALCEQRMTRKDYEDKLRLCEIDPKRGQSYFWHEYMNIPFSPSDRKFQPKWFMQLDDGNIPGFGPPFAPLSKWITVDSAWKEEEHPSGFDFTVLVVGGFDDLGRLFILDIMRNKNWTVKQGCEAIVALMKSSEYGGISRVITEKVSDNISWHTFLRERCRLAGIPLLLESLARAGAGRKNKYDRIESTQGHFEQGRVFFRRKAENFEDCVNEFCNLRRWTNDDIADAISMFFDERVRVMPPPRQAYVQSAGFHPMPYEGGESRALYATLQNKQKQAEADKQSAEWLMKPGESALHPTMTGNVFFTPQDSKSDERISFFKPMIRG